MAHGDSQQYIFAQRIDLHPHAVFAFDFEQFPAQPPEGALGNLYLIAQMIFVFLFRQVFPAVDVVFYGIDLDLRHGYGLAFESHVAHQAGSVQHLEVFGRPDIYKEVRTEKRLLDPFPAIGPLF